jgi:hypothetical protein
MMKGYIDRNKVLKLISRYSDIASEPPMDKEDEIKLTLLHRIYNEIKSIKEIVNCEDCIHYNVCGYVVFDDECTHFKNKADVVEIKYGYWKDNCNGTFTCSECEGKSSKMDWCGRCGAKMNRT